MISKKILSGILAVTMLVASVPSVMVANADNEPAKMTNITPGTKTGTMTIRLKITSYSVTLSQELGGLNIDKASVNSGTKFSATLSAKAGYDLPDTISVKIGTTDVDSSQIECGSGVIASGDKITYNTTNGNIYIPAAMVTGNITITADGVAKKFNLVYKVLAADKAKCSDLSEKGITESDTNEGVKKTVSNGATFGQSVDTANQVTLTGSTSTGKTYTFEGWYYDADKNNKINIDDTNTDKRVDLTKPIDIAPANDDPINLIALFSEKATPVSGQICNVVQDVAVKEAGFEANNSTIAKEDNSAVDSPVIVVDKDSDGVTDAEKTKFNALAAEGNPSLVARPLVALDIYVEQGGKKVDDAKVAADQSLTMTIKLSSKLDLSKYNGSLWIYHQYGTNSIEKFAASYDGDLTITFVLKAGTTFSPYTLVCEQASGSYNPKDDVPPSTGSSSFTGYTVTWDIDGQTSTEPYIENATPKYKGKIPLEKAEDANYTYTFKGWDKPFTTVHSDQTYTAVFEKTPKTTNLGTVENIAVADDGTVTWDEVPNASYYRVEKTVDGKKSCGKKTTETSYKLAVPSCDYSVRVYAVDANGSKTVSEAMAVKVKIAEGSVGAATNVKVDTNRKTVTWDAAENAASYRVVKIVNGKSYFSAVVTEPTYTFVNATKGAFSVKVVAINGSAKKWSAATSVDKQASSAGIVANPTVSDDGTVEWTAVEGAVSYNVAKTSNGKTYYIKNVKGTSAKFRSVPKGDYNVFVEAVDANGVKTVGPQVRVSAAAKATDVTIGEDGKTVTWKAVEGAKSYQLVKVINGKKIYTKKTTATTAKFNDAVTEGVYAFVITFDANGKTSYSDAVTIK